MRDSYVLAGWIATLAGVGMYAYRTVIRSREVAAQLLAIEQSGEREVAVAAPVDGPS